MAALKNLDPNVYYPTQSAWKIWMSENIYCCNPTEEALEAVPIDPGCYYALGILPPGFVWGTDYVVIREHNK